jgi:fluoroquinolone transport system permease protein
MKTFLTQLKWEFTLLQKNSIIAISFGVTLIYGILLYFFRDADALDPLLISLVLNDPSVIGYFFIALAIYTERKHDILPAIFTTPVNVHSFVLSKTISLSFIGVVCSLGLAIPLKGLDFDILSFTIGATTICLLSTLLGLYMLTFANEFLKFAMLSIPVFLAFVNIPLLRFLGVIDLGFVSYLFPIQGSLDLIDAAIQGTEINYWLCYVSILATVPLFYWLAYRRFSAKIIHK